VIATSIETTCRPPPPSPYINQDFGERGGGGGVTVPRLYKIRIHFLIFILKPLLFSLLSG
jgi:hypothetical protein